MDWSAGVGEDCSSRDRTQLAAILAVCESSCQRFHRHHIILVAGLGQCTELLLLLLLLLCVCVGGKGEGRVATYHAIRETIH